MRKMMIALVLAGAAVASSAAAQSWRLQPRVQREIQNDINQLDAQISRATERRVISRKDATSLRRDAANLQRTFNRYSRDGLDRREVADLESQVNRLRVRLRLERRQWDDRRR